VSSQTLIDSLLLSFVGGPKFIDSKREMERGEKESYYECGYVNFKLMRKPFLLLRFARQRQAVKVKLNSTLYRVKRQKRNQKKLR
jgi:hypothetical protein